MAKPKTQAYIRNRKPKPVEKVKPEPTPTEELVTVRTRQKAHNLGLRSK